MNDVLVALSLTLVAGLSTGIGSLIALFSKRTNTKFLAFSMGLSAGVMIFVSMVELYADANRLLSLTYGAKMGAAYTAISFFGGMGLIALIDKLLPAEDNPHELKFVEDMSEDNTIHKKSLMRTGVFTAIAIAVHNFPEGMATFVSAMQNPQIAFPIVAAIAIHNIPEGIAVSVPVFYATGSRWKAFKLSFLSGLSEPLGALIGYLVLLPFMSDTMYAVLFAGIAGIMVFISVDELLPSAREYGEHHLSIYGMVLGMIIMAISLILFI
ncbi:MAG: zinc transporter ZupT [Oscillospiraceae bacterium]